MLKRLAIGVLVAAATMAGTGAPAIAAGGPPITCPPGQHPDPTTYVEVVQRGEFGLLADGVPPFMPESLLNDPARIADLQARCM